MLKKLHLKNFKGFKDADLDLGNFSLLVGTNASGKSNVIDALRFIHGISRGYYIAEITGGKYQAGALQWRGIRGGIQGLLFKGKNRTADNFSIKVAGKLLASQREYEYYIEVNPSEPGEAPRIFYEYLTVDGIEKPIFQAKNRQLDKAEQLEVSFQGEENKGLGYRSDIPVISQIINRGLNSLVPKQALQYANGVTIGWQFMQFMDLEPDLMRQPSSPGQQLLGDHGENLSSVIQELCKTQQGKENLVSWIQELTPMDVRDFKFSIDLNGKILLTLIEKEGKETLAYSASDGTLRFLAIITSLFSVGYTERLYFWDEIDTGIHPTRLHLLIQLIEYVTAENDIQVVATTHSPQLLNLLSPESLEHASLTYRLPDRPDAQIKRILDIPDARRLIEEQDIATLHESGWLEDAVYFTDDEPAAEEASV
ncbi:SMC domain protein [Thalassoporum mexicanum PCC 7367]|uniref:AAA family ATPase n=1 Tax=Thalassoporum mexicanum TaxID=3457544 RepID=UPI00029FFB69|nr:ATP-binding protein [Pseudanabaena sp. PCC 7367]AFY69479.1 SMC domain protein [Pseudanabaena sp. PCC 7367]